MKHLYLASLAFAALIATPASGQLDARSFPTFWDKPILTSQAFSPGRTPKAIDDKSKGLTMYVGQLVGQSKYRGWIKFRTSKAMDYEVVKNFTTEKDEFYQLGPYCGAYDGNDYYVILARSYTVGVYPLTFAKLDVATGDTTTIYTFTDAEHDKWYNGYDVYAMAYNPGDGNIYGLGKTYEQRTINGEEVTVGLSALYTIDKATGQFSLVTNMDGIYYNFSFDYDGNCYMVRPKAKSETDVTIVGTELAKFDSDFNQISVVECKSEWGETYIQRYFGTMTFDFSTGDLWWLPVGDHGASSLYTVDTETGQYKSRAWFNSGNSFVGLYIPYLTADNRTAAARVSGIDARADVNGAMADTIKWVNPTKAWNKANLSELKEVLIYRKKPNVKTSELTPAATLLSADNADLVATVEANNKMGEAMQWIDTNPHAGINTYYVVPSRVAGEKGVLDSIRCFMGIDVPGAVKNIQLKKKGEGIELTWDAPTEGENNGYIKESELTYTLTRMPDNVVVASDLSGTTYTDNTLGEQQKYSYKIQAKSNAGAGAIAESDGIMAGRALATPINLKFETQDDANRWYSSNTRVIYFYYSGGYDENSKCMIGYSNYSEADGFLTSPPLKLEGGKTYRITTDFYAHQKDTPFDLKLTMGKSGDDLTGAAVLRDSKDLKYPVMYARDKFEDMFTAPEDGTYYFGMYVATHDQYNNFRLYGLKVDYVADNDLKAFSINGIQEAVANYNNKCTVKVRNMGSKTQNNYGVKIYCNDEGNKVLVGETTTVPELKAGEVAEVPVEFNPTKDGLFDFYGVVELNGDQDHSNDTTAIVRIKVNPAGTIPWTNIVTSGEDEGIDSHGPTTNSDNYERKQSVYYASEIKADKDGEIKRLGYIYNSNEKLKDRTDEFKAKIYLGHTDKTGYTSTNEWMDENDLVLVYEGPFTFEPGENNILSFDLATPFKYDNTKNLVVVFDKEGAVPSNIMFCALYKVFNGWSNHSNINRSLEYSNNNPFDASKSYTYKSAPILYLGFDYVTNGINNAYVAGETFFFDNASRIITFGKGIKLANIYTVDGKLVKTINVSGNEQVRLNISSGLYIVRTIAKDGTTRSVKLNIR